MKVQYKKTELIPPGDEIFTIKITLSKSETDKMTPVELRELAYSKLDHAMGGDDG